MPRTPFECAGSCGRMVRPTRTTAEQWPDEPTVAYYAAAMCFTCYDAHSKLTPERISYVTGELLAYLRSRGREIPAELVKAVS